MPCVSAVTVLECEIQWVSPGAVIGPADLFRLCRNVFALPTPLEAPEAEAEVAADDESTPMPPPLAATLAAAAAIKRAFLSFSPLLGLCSVDVRCHIFVLFFFFLFCLGSIYHFHYLSLPTTRIHELAFLNCD